MEILLLFQPWCTASTVLLCVVTGIGSLVYFMALAIEDKDIKVLRNAIIISIVLFIPVSFVASSYTMFKNQIIYRVATSETVGKAVEALNTKLDKLNEEESDNE